MSNKKFNFEEFKFECSEFFKIAKLENKISKNRLNAIESAVTAAYLNKNEWNESETHQGAILMKMVSTRAIRMAQLTT